MLACRGERKPRLARPARAGERHESDLGTREEACDGRDLALASHERRRVGRERTGLWLRRRRRRGELELGVLAEDALLERAQLGRRLEPELVEGGASVAVRGERVGLTAGAVEGEHLLRPESLTVRVLCDERLDLRRDDVVPPGVEIRFDSGLERGESRVLEASGLGLRERFVGDVGQRGAAPERQCVPRTARGDEPVELLDVELALGRHAAGTPGARVTIRSAPSAPRRAWMCTWSAF